MESNEIDQLLISASETLANILKQIHFEAIAYNGNLEMFLKGLFATALKKNDLSDDISWIAMDKQLSPPVAESKRQSQEDMSIFLNSIQPPHHISIEFKSTLSIDISKSKGQCVDALSKTNKHNIKNHRYIIHFHATYSHLESGNTNSRDEFSNAPDIAKTCYNGLKSNFITDELITYYKKENSSIVLISTNPIPIYKIENFKIDCCILRYHAA